MRLIIYIPFFIVLTSLLSACGTFGSSSKTNTVKQVGESVSSGSRTSTSAQMLYTSANKAMNRGDFQTALEEYNSLILKYPFGAVSEQAKLDRIFIYERTSDLKTAIIAADNFIAQYPNHPNIDYAFYMKGVVLFEKNPSFLEKRSNAKSIKNKSALLASKAAFVELQQRYPDSQYVEDSQQRVIFLNNRIAEQELSTARFYKNRNASVAAVNRAKYVIDTYPKTPAAYEALVLLRDTYNDMGLIDAAKEAQDIINLNKKGGTQNLTVKKPELIKSSRQQNTKKPAFKWGIPKLPSLFKKPTPKPTFETPPAKKTILN